MCGTKKHYRLADVGGLGGIDLSQPPKKEPKKKTYLNGPKAAFLLPCLTWKLYKLEAFP